MKTKKLITLMIVLFVAFVFTQCKNENNGAPGTIQLKATGTSQGLKSAKIEALTGNITLQAATVEIQNLQIEENSGEDHQDGDQSGNDGNNDKENNSKSESGDAGDLLLAGPYVLDILNGSASVDQVIVQPGTYKKVDFDFFAGPENNNQSIVLTGIFTTLSGVEIPFTLNSDLSETVQLPLNANGITVSSGSVVTVSILFDVTSWLKNLDWSQAIQLNNQITISKNENAGLYQAFIAEVSKNIQVED